MRLTRSSLCGLLLENGEEDLAVLIARADLPDILDSAEHARTLAELGLSREDLHALLPAVSGDPRAGGGDKAELARRTVSDRWADLVSVWTGTTRPQPSTSTSTTTSADATRTPTRMASRRPGRPGPARPICAGRARRCCRPRSGRR